MQMGEIDLVFAAQYVLLVVSVFHPTMFRLKLEPRHDIIFVLNIADIHFIFISLFI